MAKQKLNMARLGIFVLAGLFFLILGLYLIGKDSNLFGSNMYVRARFANANGLVPGNNIRYSGIQVGTVRKVELLNDSTVEVTMAIKKKLGSRIHKNAIASIGTEGLIGNKIVNILPGAGNAPELEENDLLQVRKVINTDDMLETLELSNRNLAVITEELKATVKRLNNSQGLWTLLGDQRLPEDIRGTARNLRNSSARAQSFMEDLQLLLTDVKAGKGTVGALLTDSSYARQLGTALEKINRSGDHLDSLLLEAQSLSADLHQEMNQGQGPVRALLKDSGMVRKLNLTLTHLEAGTSSFNDNMEALKHSIFFRGYFRRLEKEKARQTVAEKAADKPAGY